MELDCTVFVVDNDRDIRQSLRRLLEEVDLKVEGFSSASSFLEAYDSDTPGCLLLDIRMPGMSGIELQQTMLDRQLCLPIIFITGHGDVEIAVECMKRGAFEFIQKPFRAQTLLDSIQRALSFDRDNREARLAISEAKRRFASLTAREREVAQLVVKGLSNRDIASQRGVSSQAIDAQRSKAMTKLQVANLADLVRLVEKTRQ